MRCLSCNKNLTDREASRKFVDWREIKSPEDRYIELCDACFSSSGLTGVENPSASDVEYQDETETGEPDETEGDAVR